MSAWRILLSDLGTPTTEERDATGLVDNGLGFVEKCRFDWLWPKLDVSYLFHP